MITVLKCVSLLGAFGWRLLRFEDVHRVISTAGYHVLGIGPIGAQYLSLVATQIEERCLGTVITTHSQRYIHVICIIMRDGTHLLVSHNLTW